MSGTLIPENKSQKHLGKILFLPRATNSGLKFEYEKFAWNQVKLDGTKFDLQLTSWVPTIYINTQGKKSNH